MSEPFHTSDTHNQGGMSLGPCPDLETLAAFVEGKLGDFKRADVIAHVSRCERCRELIGEAEYTTDHARDDGNEEEGARVVAGPWRARSPFLAAAAVVVVTVLATVLWLSLIPRVSEPRLVGLLPEGEELRERLGERWSEPPWSEMRSDLVIATTPEIAVRLGVRRTDLLVALRAEDRDRAIYLATDLQRLLRSEAATLPYSFLYNDLVESLRAGQPMSGIASVARDNDALLAKVEPRAYFEIGSWLEATRLAAIATQDDVSAGELSREAERWVASVSDEALLSALKAIAEEESDRAQLSAAADEAIRLLAEGEASLDEPPPD